MLLFVWHPAFFSNTRARDAPPKLRLDESKPVLVWAAVYEFGHLDLCLREQVERGSFDLKEFLDEGIDNIFSTLVLLSPLGWNLAFDKGGRSPTVNPERCAVDFFPIRLY